MHVNHDDDNDRSVAIRLAKQGISYAEQSKGVMSVEANTMRAFLAGCRQ